GGLDLRFPHHENELAQSKAVGQKFARFWMHNALVTAAGEKMSKSLGNGATVRNVVQRVRPIELRYYLVSSHYRSVVEFSDEAVEEAATSFQRIENFVSRATEVTGGVEPADELPAAFVEAMNDDLGTPAAMAVLHNTVRDGNKLLSDAFEPSVRGFDGAINEPLAAVRGMLGVLGLDPLAEPWVSRTGATEELTEVLDGLIKALLDQRQAARERKDYAASDEIRDRLKVLGVVVEDTPQGPRWTIDPHHSTEGN
ncbi:MAG TPA: DALR domain-containing protein, partial [Kribbella sp.]